MEPHARKRQQPAGHGANRPPRGPKAAKKEPFNLIKTLRQNSILAFLVGVVLVAFVLKYFEDDYHSTEGFTQFGEDIYKVMGVSRSASDADIRAKYRQLNHKWHPDKNPNCEECKEKFMKLKEAYKILSNPELKALYDRTNGRTVDMISSATTELTHRNFDELVRRSGDLWVIQVYSNDSYECQQFAKYWEDGAAQLGQYARFGRINALLQPKAARKLPVKVQLYPAVLMLYPSGKYDLFPQTVVRDLNEFRKYFTSVYPDSVARCKDHPDFKKRAGNRPALIFRHSGGRKTVPLAVMHVAQRFAWAFDTFWVSTDANFHDDEALVEDMTTAAEGGSNILTATAMFLLQPGIDAVALYYGPKAAHLLATAPYIPGAPDVLLKNVREMLALSFPPLELSVDSFDHLCLGAGDARDRFCLVLAGDAPEKPDARKVVEKVAQYHRLAAIGSVFSNPDEDADKAPVATADVVPVRLPSAGATQKFRDVTASRALLLDAMRGKFCVLCFGARKCRYDCEAEEDAELGWVGDVAEGAADTLTWHDAAAAFGGKFQKQCLVPKRPWYRFF